MLAYLITYLVTQQSGVSSRADFWWLWPLLAAGLAAVMWVARRSERLVRSPLPGLRPGLTVALVVVAGFALVKAHPDNQRCIDRRTMTVAVAADCQNSGSHVGPIPYTWYYGGSGTRIGDSVQGGSLTPPADNDGGRGGAGVGSDDGGDGGGDGGGGGGDR